LVFYFGLFLPIVFITASLSLTRKEQLFNSLISSVAILFLYYLGLLLNRSIGVLGFLNFEPIPYFNGFESPSTIAILLLFLFGLMMSSVFFRKSLKNSLSPWSLAHIYLCIFLVTAFVTTENLLIFLFACESFIWLNFYQFNSGNENKSTLYFQSATSTGILLILTVFLGLLENISLSEMSYSLENMSKISLSYVSGTIYSTQTLFFMMSSLYIALKISFLIHLLTYRFFEKSIKLPGVLLSLFGVPAILYCFLYQQSHFYNLAFEEYGDVSIIFCILLILTLFLLQFQKQLSSWSKKWTN
jgi:hypothetical protein